MNKPLSVRAGVVVASFLLLFVLGLILSGVGQAQGVAADGKGAFSVRYTAQFSQDDFSFSKLMDYDLVGLKDGDWMAELGKPMLPSKEIKIALPTGMAVKGVWVVNCTEEQVPGEYNIYPSQPPLTTAETSSGTDFIPPDQQTYSSSQSYPAEVARFVNQTDLAGQSMAVVEFFPLRYIPGQNKLTYCSSLTIEINGVAGYECGDYLSPNVSENGRKTYEQMV
ncbi:MAG TPA: C25 family peptidase propeptide domain-containing protein, partial [candidate division Zixibacteria bacterium]